VADDSMVGNADDDRFRVEERTDVAKFVDIGFGYSAGSVAGRFSEAERSNGCWIVE